MTDRVLNTLGLARRGGNLAMGEEPVAEAVKSRRARAVFVAADAAENTVRRITRLTAESGTVLVTLPHSKDEIGFALGRSTCALLAVTDAGLAAAAAKKLAETDGERYGSAAALLEEKAGRIQRRKREKSLEKKQTHAGKRPGGSSK